MTMHTNLRVDDSLCPGGFEAHCDNSNESRDIFFCRWDFGSCRVLVVGYRCALEGGWIVCCIHSCRNIDYVPNLGVLTDEMEGRMSSVSLSECLNELWKIEDCTFMARRGDFPINSETFFTFFHFPSDL